MDETDRVKRRSHRLLYLSLFLAVGDCVPGLVIAVVANISRCHISFHGLLGCILFVLIFLPMPIAGVLVGVLAYRSTNHHVALFPLRSWVIVSICLAILVIGQVMLEVFFSTHSYAFTREQYCLNNQRRLMQAIMIYEEEHNYYLPHDFSELTPYLRNDETTLKCPDSVQAIGYGYNRFAIGLSFDDVNKPQTMLITADGGNTRHLLERRGDIDDRRHVHEISDVILEPNPAHGFVAGYADGHTAVLLSGAKVQLQP